MRFMVKINEYYYTIPLYFYFLGRTLQKKESKLLLYCNHACNGKECNLLLKNGSVGRQSL